MMQIKNQFTKDVKYHGLFWAVAILIITLLFWAGFSKVDQVTVAGGKVIPDKKVQVIQHKDGGILSEIFVHEGQRVKKGEVLAQIDSKEYKSQYNQGKSQEADLKLTTFRLRALLDGVSFDPKKIPGYKTYNKKLLDTQKALYDALKSENIAKKMVFSQKIKTKEQETSLAKERL